MLQLGLKLGLGPGNVIFLFFVLHVKGSCDVHGVRTTKVCDVTMMYCKERYMENVPLWDDPPFISVWNVCIKPSEPAVVFACLSSKMCCPVFHSRMYWSLFQPRTYWSRFHTSAPLHTCTFMSDATRVYLLYCVSQSTTVYPQRRNVSHSLTHHLSKPDKHVLKLQNKILLYMSTKQLSECVGVLSLTMHLVHAAVNVYTYQ